MLNVSHNSQLSLVLDAATPEGTNVLVYLASWRDATYTLTASSGAGDLTASSEAGEWSVASGLESYSLGGPDGNVLTPDTPTSFTGGVLRYTGSLDTLDITSDADPDFDFSSQLITIALEGPVDPGPTPPGPTPPGPTPPGPNPPEPPGPPGPTPAPVTPAGPRFTG